MAHLATVGSHSVNGVAALHTELIKSRPAAATSIELWPERFNNKTNGVTPRRWVLYANPRLTRLVTQRHRPGVDRPRPRASSSGCCAHADDPSLLDELCAGQARTTSATWRRWCSARTGVDAAAGRDVRRPDQALPRVQAAAAGLPADRRALPGAQAQPGADALPRTYIFAGKAAPGYVMAKLHIKLINDVAAVINADPAVRGRLAVVFLPELRRVSGAGAHPGGRHFAADLDRGQGGVGHQQHEVRAQRRAHHRHARRRQRRDPRSGRARTTSSSSGSPRAEVHALWADRLRSARVHRAQRRARRGAGSDLGSASSAWARCDRFEPIMNNLRDHDPFMVCADFDAYAAAEARAAEAVPRSARLVAPRALQHRGRRAFLQRRDRSPLRRRDLAHHAGEDRSRLDRRALQWRACHHERAPPWLHVASPSPSITRRTTATTGGQLSPHVVRLRPAPHCRTPILAYSLQGHRRSSTS